MGAGLASWLAGKQAWMGPYSKYSAAPASCRSKRNRIQVHCWHETAHMEGCARKRTHSQCGDMG